MNASRITISTAGEPIPGSSSKLNHRYRNLAIGWRFDNCSIGFTLERWLMKTPSRTRRLFRRTSLNREAGAFKKESRQEEAFFGGTHREPFFRPRPPAGQPKTSTHSSTVNRVQSVHIVNSVKGTVQRQADPLPNFSQGDFDSCGAASIVAAIMINDRQASAGGVPNNSGFLSAANIVLSYYSMHQNEVIAGLQERKRLSQEKATERYSTLRTILMNVREN